MFNDELKESEVIAICRDAGIITKNIYNIMRASLGRRNAAAHPSSVINDQLQTDAYIVDLIQTVILQFRVAPPLTASRPAVDSARARSAQDRTANRAHQSDQSGFWSRSVMQDSRPG
jgi:hypothetical protein